MVKRQGFQKAIGYQKAMRRKPTSAEYQFKVALAKFFAIRYSVDFEVIDFNNIRGRNFMQSAKFKRAVRQQRIFETKTDTGRIKHYIVDFYIPAYKVVFEIDGATHTKDHQKHYDAVRTMFLRQQKKVRLVRVPNEDTKDIAKCLTIIKEAFESEPVCLPWHRRHEKAREQKQMIPRAEQLRLQQEFMRNHGINQC